MFWGEVSFSLSDQPRRPIHFERPSIYIWVDIAPKSEKIGKNCTFFFKIILFVLSTLQNSPKTIF